MADSDLTTMSHSENWIRGIDVSRYQQVVNWQDVADTGVAFAYARASQGRQYTDPYFATNWSLMSTANLIRGAYHVFRPSHDALEQANHFISHFTTQLEPGDLPPALDLEDLPDEAPITGDIRNDVLDAVQLWLDTIEAALGRQPIIYTNRPFWRDRLGNSRRFAQYYLWIANYTTATSPKLPNPWLNWVFWQYSDSGTIPGIIGTVDLNWFNGNQAQLNMLASLP